MLTLDIMDAMWPHGDDKVAGLRMGTVATAPAVFQKYGLISDLLVAHAMAQFSEECGAGGEVEEYLDYSANRLVQVWPSHFDQSNAGAYAHNPQKLANFIYDDANRGPGYKLGNTQPGDGWAFRGRGGSQTTGRQAYSNLAQKVGLDLLNQPGLLNDARYFLECAVADFVQCGCLPFAASDDVSGVTRHLNGAYTGLAERTDWLRRWKAALNVTLPVPHTTAWVQDALNKLGAQPPLLIDSSYGPITEAALKTFQTANGLPVDGEVGPQTFAALDAALAALNPPGAGGG